MKARRIISSVVCASLLMVVAGAAEAASIGLNFVGGRSGTGGGTGGSDGDDVPAGQTAGVVPQDYWNNGFGPNNAAGLPLVDNGNLPTGAVATWSGVPNCWTVSGSGTAADADAALMNGYIDTNNSSGFTTVTVANVPYSEYDVIVYCDGDATGGRSGTYTVNGITLTPLADVGNWPYTGPAPTAGAYDDATVDLGGNYAVWTGLTGSPLVVTADEAATGGGFRAPINAIQIVGIGEIPEPVTMLAVGLGITGLGGYIRSRRRS
jgi:hypothetical protein